MSAWVKGFRKVSPLEDWVELACLAQTPARQSAHQLDPYGAAVLALRVLLGPAQEAELVLDGVPVLVCDDVLLSQRSAVRAEAAGQLGKEAGVDIDLRVRGAVERADLVGRRSTRGRGGAGIQDGVDGAVGLAETRELVGPEKSCTLLTVPMTRHCTSRLASAPVLHCEKSLPCAPPAWTCPGLSSVSCPGLMPPPVPPPVMSPPNSNVWISTTIPTTPPGMSGPPAPASAAAPDLGRVKVRIVVEARGGSARSRKSSSPPRLGLNPARRVRHTGVCPYAVF